MDIEMPPRRETWIGRAEWNTLLRRSRDLMDQAERLRRNGQDNADVWKKIAPINQTLRSPLLKVRGIDDRCR